MPPLAKKTIPSSKRFFVCAHTHWDREWYGTFQDFRMRLVYVVDEILALLKNQKEFRVFHLDGQMAPLLDYIQIRPEQAETIRNFVQSGRLRVGPWFVLPDEFLVSGESLVRNFQHGIRLMHEWGGETQVAYSPDAFGRPSQMPQILQGFGLKYSLIWRGFSSEKIVAEAWWEAPDGSRILCWALPEDQGYGDLAMGDGALPAETRSALGDRPGFMYHRMLPLEGAQQVLRDRAALRGTAAQGDNIMLLAGIDHQRPQIQLPELLAWGQQELKQEFTIGSLDEYFGQLSKSVAQNKVKPTVVKGKLRNTLHHNTGNGAYVLPGVLSSRIHLKQRNHEAQTLLERFAEPLSAFWWLAGGQGENGFLREAWRNLLENHPHDSICGCSVDLVHRQMESRFDAATEIGKYLCDFRLADFIRDTDLSSMPEDESALILFNPLPWAVGGVIRAELRWRGDLLSRYKIGKIVDLRGVEVLSKDGTQHPVQILGPVEARIISTPHLREYSASVHEWLCVPISIQVPALPPGGYEVFRYRILKQKETPPSVLSDSANLSLENKWLRVRWIAGEGLEVTNKTTGKIFRGLLRFEDTGDNGDLYAFSPPIDNETIVGGTTQASVTQEGSLSSTLRLVTDLEVPESLDDTLQRRSSKRVRLRIETDITLNKDARSIECVSTLINPCRDHRLRVLFPTDEQTNLAWSEGAFHVDSWPCEIRQPRLERGFFEDEPNTFPQQSFVCAEGKKEGLALFNRGLPEFQLMPDERRTLALTLFRSVRRIGTWSINTRSAPAGPPIPTPDGQCLGPMRFEYAIHPYKGNWKEAEVWRAAHAYTAPVRSLTNIEAKGSGPAQRSFVQVEGKGVACSTIKQSEDGKHLVVRLWNTTAQKASARVRLGHEVTQAKKSNLNEKPLEDLEVDRTGFVRAALNPHEIVSILVKVNRDPVRPASQGQKYPVWRS